MFITEQQLSQCNLGKEHEQSKQMPQPEVKMEKNFSYLNYQRHKIQTTAVT